MNTILIKKGNKYDCNDNSESDHIGLQSLSKGQNMMAMSKIILDYDFWTNLA